MLTGQDLQTVVGFGVVPFVTGDALKILIAWVALRGVRPQIFGREGA
jgi:biotin transporter BioY